MLENVETTGGARPTMEIPAETNVAEYARVEIMGHRERVGQVQEVTRFGVPMLRVDFYDMHTDAPATEFYAGSALFCVSPVDKSVVDVWEERQRSYRAPSPRHLPAPEDDREDDADDLGDMDLEHVDL